MTLCRKSLQLFCSSGLLCLSPENASVLGVTLFFAVSTVWDPADLWWVTVENETRHFLEQSTCHSSAFTSKRNQGTWENGTNPTSAPPYSQDMAKVYIPVRELPHMILHSHQLCVSDGVRGLPVEMNSPREKIFIIPPSVLSSKFSWKFSRKTLSVFPSLVQKQGVPNQNAGPKGCLQNHRVCEVHEGNSCLFIICRRVKVSFAGKSSKLAMVRASHRMVAFMLSSSGAVIIKSGLHVLWYQT